MTLTQESKAAAKELGRCCARGDLDRGTVIHGVQAILDDAPHWSEEEGMPDSVVRTKSERTALDVAYTMAYLATVPARTIMEYAHDARLDWGAVKPIPAAARPYLDAMRHLCTSADFYGCDPATEVVLRFLCNAQSWRGPVARVVKAKLRQLVGVKS